MKPNWKIDSKTEKQEEKVDTLEEYKKGLMQKIFSQEIRFKDENGNEYPEWEEKRLGDIVEFHKGSDLSKKAYQKREGISVFYMVSCLPIIKQQ